MSARISLQNVRKLFDDGGATPLVAIDAPQATVTATLPRNSAAHTLRTPAPGRGPALAP